MDSHAIRRIEIAATAVFAVVALAYFVFLLQWYAVESNVEVRPEQFDAWLPAHWIPVAMNRDVTLWKLQE